MSNEKRVSIHTLTKRSDLTVQMAKGKGTESDKEKVTVAIVNVVNHRPRIATGKLLQFETFMNTHGPRFKDKFPSLNVIPTVSKTG